MSDPSIIIATPSNIWVLDDRHTSSRCSRRDLPKNKHMTKKRRRHRLLSSSSSSRSSSYSHKRDKRSKKSKHSHKRRRSRSLSFSCSSSDHSVHDYGRYKRPRLTPQVAEIQSTLQPVMTMDQTPIIHSDNVVQQLKDSGSESDTETRFFDRAINEVFRLLPQKLCPRPTLLQSHFQE